MLGLSKENGQAAETLAPGRQIVLLYDGAIRRIEEARQATPKEEIDAIEFHATDVGLRREVVHRVEIDEWFAAKTKGLNDLAKAQLKQRWGTLQKVLSSQSRLEMIVADMDWELLATQGAEGELSLRRFAR